MTASLSIPIAMILVRMGIGILSLYLEVTVPSTTRQCASRNKLCRVANQLAARRSQLESGWLFCWAKIAEMGNEYVNVISLAVGIIGLLLAAYFGVRTIIQTQNFDDLKRALKAYNQGLYNDVWRVGANAGEAMETDNLELARRKAQGIGDMSQLIRHHVVAFSNRHTGFTPYFEPAWQPKPLPTEEPRSWLDKFFQL